MNVKIIASEIAKAGLAQLLKYRIRYVYLW